LDVVIERYDAVYGDIENETGEIGDVALEAFDKLIWCTPASMDGVRALLTYMLDDVADLGTNSWKRTSRGRFLVQSTMP